MIRSRPPIALPILLAAALALIAALLLAAPRGAPLIGPESAAAAACKGADRAPRKMRQRRAQRLILCLVNRKRRKEGMRRLRPKRKLAKAARRHSRRMVRTGCFSHTCPGERDLVGRAHRSGYLPCNCGWKLGETIAWGPGRRGSPRRIFKSWMSSSGHRAQLLDRGYRHAGVGVRWGAPGSKGARAGVYTVDLGAKR